jgi:mevalonyl-CoA hydratase
MSLRSGQLHYENFFVSFPDTRILLITLNKPQKLNCVDLTTSRQIQDVWERFDRDESLWVGIITGTGRAFCTGADLQGKVDSFYFSKRLPVAADG